jgi:GxxExxY protein
MTIRRADGLLEEKLTESVIGSFFDVHRELGYGYREYIYSLAMERALIAKGHRVEREVRVMIYFRGKELAWESVDVLVDGTLMVENKAGERVPPDASEQLFGYLCATTFELGLILHFGRQPKFHRVIFENRYKAHFIRTTKRLGTGSNPSQPSPLVKTGAARFGVTVSPTWAPSARRYPSIVAL